MATKISKINFSKNAQNGLIWPENYKFLCANSSYWKITGLLFSGELLGTGSIHNLDYWKLAGLALGLLFSGELMETGGIHNSGYWKIGLPQHAQQEKNQETLIQKFTCQQVNQNHFKNTRINCLISKDQLCTVCCMRISMKHKAESHEHHEGHRLVYRGH